VLAGMRKEGDEDDPPLIFFNEEVRAAVVGLDLGCYWASGWLEWWAARPGNVFLLFFFSVFIFCFISSI
jgi:hypothetical protein